MGVPGFFSYLNRNRELKRSILTQNQKYDVDILYFDFNSVIHNSAAQVRKNSNLESLRTTEIENLIVTEVIRASEEIIGYVNPRVEVFIAIDGACPMGKIVQQRERRLKTSLDSGFMKRVKRKHGISEDIVWQTSKISPGTQFMYKLEQRLRKHFGRKSRGLGKIVVSGSNVSGEGEHKIKELIIRSNRKQLKHCIYGLDADLLFLSTILEDSGFDVKLIRETLEIGDRELNEKEKFTWVDVGILKKEIDIKLGSKNTLDFIYLCFLLGNDFVSSVPTLSIYKNGIPLLVHEYKKNKKGNEALIKWDTREVNYSFLQRILVGVSRNENAFLRSQYIEYQNRVLPDRLRSKSEYEKEVYIYENLIGHKDDLQMKGLDLESDKVRYYARYFPQGVKRDDVCLEYLKSLNWCFSYYMSYNLSWEYSYSYHKGPFVSDICAFLRTSSNNLIFEYEFGRPMYPIEQLLIIIPSTDKNIIPKSFRPLVEKYSKIPGDVKVDKNYISKRYKMVFFLPSVDIAELRRDVKEIYSRAEKKNKYTEYLFHSGSG
jgi:5'-3' exonuclease